MCPNLLDTNWAYLCCVVHSCILAEWIVKRAFYCIYSSQVLVCASGNICGKAATSFWMRDFFFLLFLQTSPHVCCHITHLHWEDSEHSSFLSSVSNCAAQLLQMQQLFQKHKMKEKLRSLSQLRVNKCLKTLHIIFNAAYLFQLFFLNLHFCGDLLLFFSNPFIPVYMFLVQANISILFID